MILKDVEKIDEKLTKMYENQITTNANTEHYIDKSDVLLNQMTFIAMNNKSFFKF